MSEATERGPHPWLQVGFFCVDNGLVQLLHKNNIGGVTREGGFIWLDGSICFWDLFKRQ